MKVRLHNALNETEDIEMSAEILKKTWGDQLTDMINKRKNA